VFNIENDFEKAQLNYPLNECNIWVFQVSIRRILGGAPRTYYGPDKSYSGILCVGIIGLVLGHLFSYIRAKSFCWVILVVWH